MNLTILQGRCVYAALKLRVETYCLLEGKMMRVASQFESCDEAKMMSVRLFSQSVAGRLWCFKLRTKQVQIVHSTVIILKQQFLGIILSLTKGQLISKCLFGAIISTKIATKML